MTPKDFLTLIHPAIAIFFVFPLIGMVVNFAWQTRQRRLHSKAEGKSKIPPIVGPEHLKLGKWLSASVVSLALIGIAHPIYTKFLSQNGFGTDPFRASFILAMFALTIASLVFLFKAKTKLWRAVFATLTGAGVIILGCQPEVFRRGSEWYVSHYYYGIVAAMLMIFSLAIIPEIYQDQRWRTLHAILNSLALLFFIGQAMTGTRDLLEIPLSWQEQHIYQCDFENLVCPPPPPPPPPPAS